MQGSTARCFLFLFHAVHAGRLRAKVSRDPRLTSHPNEHRVVIEAKHFLPPLSDFLD